MYTDFNLKNLLNIIFRVTNKNANILAECYLLKDKSIISKWKNSSVVPRNDDIESIIKFVLNESTGTQKQIIRNDIEYLIKASPLNTQLKDIIFNSKDFRSFLEEALSASISANANSNASHIKTLNFDHTKSENNIKGFVENKNGTYKGILEFDLNIPNSSGDKTTNSGSTGIDFKGNIKLNSKSKIVSAAKHLKKTSVLGLIFACIVSGSLIAHNNNQNNTETSSPTSNSIILQASTATKSPTQTNTYTPEPTITPVSTPTLSPADNTTPIPSSSKTGEKADQNKPSKNIRINGDVNNISGNQNNNTTIINNETHTQIINITGDNNTYYGTHNATDNAVDISLAPKPTLAPTPSPLVISTP